MGQPFPSSTIVGSGSGVTEQPPPLVTKKALSLADDKHTNDDLTTPTASSPNLNVDDCDFFDYIRVFENVGTKIYKYFQPEEIFRFSLSNKRIHEHVGQHLMKVFKQNFHLPFTFDLGCSSMAHLDSDFDRKHLEKWRRFRVSRTKAIFSTGRIVMNKDRMIHSLLQMLEGSAMRVVGTQSSDESSIVAWEMLNCNETVELELVNEHLDASVRLQPNHASGRVMETGIGKGWMYCQYNDNLEREVAKSSLVDSFFSGAHLTQYRSFAKSWLSWLLSQRDIVTQHWKMVFIHPNNIETAVTEGLTLVNGFGDNVTVSFRTRA